MDKNIGKRDDCCDFYVTKIKWVTIECFLTSDIGVYNTCKHFCRYCYVNYSTELVQKNWKQHDLNSLFFDWKL